MNYTCADKSDIEGSEFKSFEEVIFLGASPVHVSDKDHFYVGRCKESSIYDSLQFTRNNNLTIVQELTAKIEFLSMYNKQVYEDFLKRAQEVVELHQLDFVWSRTQEDTRILVSNRTTIFVPVALSQGPEDNSTMSSQQLKPLSETPDLPNVNKVVQGLTTMTTNDIMPASDYEASTIRDNAGRAINEKAMDLSFGLDSMVKRTTIEWSTANNLGDVISQIHLPWGLLQLGNQNNIQNMPFNNFIYFVGDLELTFQVNGTPTQAGLLTAYHVPLYNGTPRLEEWTTFNHVLLSPADNSTKKLYVPFRFWRTAMNTFAGPSGEETLGKLNIGVTAPLSSLGVTTASITIFSRFVNAKFSIPRPLAVAQGNSSSTKVTYNIQKVCGDMPSEAKIDNNNSAKVKAKAAPMDNPPITGCSLPIAPIFPSMSKNKGLEPTVSMQHDPTMMNREAHLLTDPSVTDINSILGRKYLWRWDTWAASAVAGTTIYDVPLNNLLLDDSAYVYDGNVSLALSILNRFARWRADFVFEIYVNRTAFHSGRLLATTAYGAPAISSGTENIYYNEVLDFNGDNYWKVIKVVYNASTEFLRSYEGPGAVEKILDHALGRFKLTVQNPLKITSTVVPDTVGVYTFIRFENVRVYELKLTPFTTMNNTFPNPTLTAQGADAVAQNDDPKPMAADNSVDPSRGDGASTTNSEADLVSDKPYSLEIGRKYEYTISNLLEIMRRHYMLTPDKVLVQQKMYSSNPPATSDATLFKLEVRPHHPFNELFAGWSGHMKYRIIVESTVPVYFAYVCNNLPSTIALDGGALVNSAWSSNSTTGLNPQKTITTYLDGAPNNVPWELAYPVSNNLQMIDVSIPFNTHLNYLPSVYNDTFGGELGSNSYNFSNGYLAMYSRNTSPYFRIFEAAGDDFRYHLWRPIVVPRMRPYRGGGSATSGEVIGDNRF